VVYEPEAGGNFEEGRIERSALEFDDLDFCF